MSIFSKDISIVCFKNDLYSLVDDISDSKISKENCEMAYHAILKRVDLLNPPLGIDEAVDKLKEKPHCFNYGAGKVSNCKDEFLSEVILLIEKINNLANQIKTNLDDGILVLGSND